VLEWLIVISDEWLLEWDESENQSAYWDSHSLEIQRFYNIVCLIYGSDPERFRDMRSSGCWRNTIRSSACAPTPTLTSTPSRGSSSFAGRSSKIF
jgi:hypothetical protein